MKKEELKQEAPTVIACCVKCGKPTNLEQYVDKILIEELEKYKSMMEEVRDGRRNHSFNDFIVGFGRTIEGLKQ